MHGESLGECRLARYGEYIREKVLLTVQPDVIYLTSLFDGYGESVVSSMAKADSRCVWTCSLYDLIPLLNPGQYLADLNMRNWYMRKIDEILKADMLFAISGSAGREALDALNFPAERVVNVGTGVNDFFSEMEFSPEACADFLRRFGIQRKFIMYSGAADPRKNLSRLIDAYSILPDSLRQEYQLVFVSKIYENEQQALRKCAEANGVADDFIITGYVSDEDLRLAYHLCSLFVFPSLHEGFGIPIAEASLCGAVVVGSNRTSVPEIICMNEALFNPEDCQSMASVMTEALTSEAFRRKNKTVCKENCKSFRWNHVAKNFLKGLECSVVRDKVEAKKCVAMVLPANLSDKEKDFFEQVYIALGRVYDVTLVYLDPMQQDDHCAFLENTCFDRRLFCISSFAAHNARVLSMAQFYTGTLLLGEMSKAEFESLFKIDNSNRLNVLYQRYGYEAVIYANRNGMDSALAQYPVMQNIDDFVDGVFCMEVSKDILMSSYPDLFRGIIDLADDSWVLGLAKAYKGISLSRYDLHCLFKNVGVPSDEESYLLADAIGDNVYVNSKKQILVDVTILSFVDAKTGIQRVVKNSLLEMLHMDVDGYRIEPVYLDNGKIRYARAFMNRFFNLVDQVMLDDEVIDAKSGDIFLGLDLNLDRIKPMEKAFKLLKARGVKVQFVVYDLLPIQYPEFFRGIVAELYPAWLDSISAISDRLICISRSVADELEEYLLRKNAKRNLPLNIDFFHLGADLKQGVSVGFTDIAETLFREMDRRPSFLMVSTIEPRKGYGIIFDTFKSLWQQGHDVNLIVVGKVGWNVDRLVHEFDSISEKNKRFFWLEGISDELLNRVYEKSDCLIAASYGEGFGLPIIEAAQHNSPVIARDIPVFREVAGEGAVYFSHDDVDEIGDVILNWVNHKEQYENSAHNIQWLTWQASTEQLIDVVLGKANYKVYRGKL